MADDSNKKEETEIEKRNKALREKYAKEAENFEATSNQILAAVRNMGVSVHAPDPSETPKQSPEEIADIHIVISQQNPNAVVEAIDTSEQDEKNYQNALDKQAEHQEVSNSDDSDDD